MDKFFNQIGKFVFGVAVVFLVSILFAFPTMWAWNAFFPDVFGVKYITAMQAFCLNYIAGVLVKAAPQKKDS